jgi:hypothetical protein
MGKVMWWIVFYAKILAVLILWCVAIVLSVILLPFNAVSKKLKKLEKFTNEKMYDLAVERSKKKC